MAHIIRAADGGYLLNSNQFHYTKDEQGSYSGEPCRYQRI